MANGNGQDASEAAGAGGITFPEGGGATPPPQPEVRPGGTEARPNSGAQISSVSGSLKVNPQLIRPRDGRRGITPTAKSQEVATLVVRGNIYEDWETVWIHWNNGEPFAQFRFTATEEVYATPGIPQFTTTWRSLAQFAPGDEFQAYLGGQPTMKGVILVRQTAYDAKSKTIVLQGVSLTWYAARASAMSEKGEYEGTFVDIAREVLKPTCSDFKIIGTISNLKYDEPQRPSGGETIFQFLERIGRNRNVMVVSDPYGDFVFIGDHNGKTVADLLEGENILKMQAIIQDTQPYSIYKARSSKPANDQTHMAAAAQIEAERQGTAKCYSPLVVTVEHPATKPEAQLRADHEYDFNERKVEANITVQGWFNPHTGLRWDVNDDVYVKAPMAMLDMLMKIEAVTFTQDSRSGSLTVLKCVAPWNWNDNNWLIGPNNHDIIQPPNEPAKANDAPATTPPEQVPHSEWQQQVDRAGAPR